MKVVEQYLINFFFECGAVSFDFVEQYLLISWSSIPNQFQKDLGYAVVKTVGFSGNCTRVAQGTVAVWTPKKFFPLLIRPQGSQGCQKITFFFSQMKVFSFCAKIAPKRHKLKKTSKLKKKCQKNPVFLDIFKYSSILGQS